ncbi:MAG TPA: T9SS type A sorting domain-containing protein, partial [Bacteroidales bacterium]|nr:T9SS type A sorting domain-containing protein [Bacteroidales bacterium]
NVSLTVSNTFTPNTTLTKTGYIKVGGIGINETTKATVTVGPNPATDFVNVTSTNTIKEVQVYNLLGQIVYNQKVNNTSLTINTASLQSGLYNVKVVMADGSIIRKVVID